jgi:hypothetical protein
MKNSNKTAAIWFIFITLIIDITGWGIVIPVVPKLIEELITKYSKGKIIVLSENDKLEPEEELVKDIMAIMNVYVAKMNGLRKYKKLKNN